MKLSDCKGVQHHWWYLASHGPSSVPHRVSAVTHARKDDCSPSFVEGLAVLNVPCVLVVVILQYRFYAPVSCSEEGVSVDDRMALAVVSVFDCPRW